MRRGLAECSKFVAPVAVCSRCSPSWGVAAVPAGMVGGQGRSCRGGIEWFQWEKTQSCSPNHSADGKCSRALNCQAPAGVIPSFSANTLTAGVGGGSFPSHFTKRSSFSHACNAFSCLSAPIPVTATAPPGHRRRLAPVPHDCGITSARTGCTWAPCGAAGVTSPEPQGFPWCCPSRRALQRALTPSGSAGFPH